MGVKLTWDAHKQAYVPSRTGNVHEKPKASPEKPKASPNETLSGRAQQAYGTEREAERPYRNYTVERLFAEKQGTEDALRDTKREKAAYLKRVYGRPPYRPGVYEDEDYVSMSRHIDRLSKDRAEINAELFIRRQQGKGASKGPRSGNLVTVACSCRPPRRFRLAGTAYDGGPIICGNCNQPFKLAL